MINCSPATTLKGASKFTMLPVAGKFDESAIPVIPAEVPFQFHALGERLSEAII